MEIEDYAPSSSRYLFWRIEWFDLDYLMWIVLVGEPPSFLLSDFWDSNSYAPSANLFYYAKLFVSFLGLPPETMFSSWSEPMRPWFITLFFLWLFGYFGIEFSLSLRLLPLSLRTAFELGFLIGSSSSSSRSEKSMSFSRLLISKLSIKSSKTIYFLSILTKNFWACDRAWVLVLVLTCSWTFRHSFP